jgi:dynein intermediate chain
VKLSSGSKSLHRIKWAPSGRHVAVGDSTGKILLYQAGEDLLTPRPDDAAKFDAFIRRLQNAQ